jgi:hypothetical protein
MLPIAKVTVAALRTMAIDILGTDVKVPSKILKADLYKLVSEAMDALHIQASNMDADREARKALVKSVAAGYRAVNVKGYNARMDSRVAGYTAQRNGGKLTAKQERRIAQKRNRQYGKLLAQLAAA